MTKLNYLGGLLLAFVLGGIGVWALQGHYSPLLNHLVAQIETHLPQSASQAQSSTPTPSNAQQLGSTSLLAPAKPLQIPFQQSPQRPFQQRFQQPFQQMRHIQQQMNQFFNHNGFSGGNNPANNLAGQSGLFGHFGSWLSHQPGKMDATITRGEDADSVFYKVKLGQGEDLDKVKVNVADGYVSINARLQNKSSHSYSASSVSERFPVPSDVEPNSAKIARHGDTIMIRFKRA